ncbi:hypothetical protein D3C87_1564530 [compost metagenome]
MPGGGLGRDEHAAHVDGQGLVEVFEFELGQRCDRQYAGIVDQDVQATEGFHRGGHGTADGVGVGAVGLDGQGLAALGGDAVLQFFSFRRRADVSEGNGRAFSSQALDDGCTDAAGTTLNQCHFAAEVLSSHVDLQVPRRDVPVDGA